MQSQGTSHRGSVTSVLEVNRTVCCSDNRMEINSAARQQSVFNTDALQPFFVALD